MPGCFTKKKESNEKGEILFSYAIGTGLMLSDNQAHDALIAGDKAVNDAYYATPKPDPGTRITGSIAVGNGLNVEYNWSKDDNGNWNTPSTLTLTFDYYSPNPYSFAYKAADDVVFNGNCSLDLAGGDPPKSLQYHIRLDVYLRFYYYPKPGTTIMTGMPAQSDYTITENSSPVYSVCYAGSVAGRNVIPLVESGGDGCLPCWLYMYYPTY